MENSKAYKKKKTCCFNCSSLRGSSLTSQLGRVVLKYILFVFIFFHHVILLFLLKFDIMDTRDINFLMQIQSNIIILLQIDILEKVTDTSDATETYPLPHHLGVTLDHY